MRGMPKSEARRPITQQELALANFQPLALAPFRISGFALPSALGFRVSGFRHPRRRA